MDTPQLLERLANDFAAVVSTVDAEAEHDRWQAGIGPFEEDRQVEMLRDAVEGDTSYSIETEAPYLDGGQRVDLFIESEETAIPVEAKLLRFRYWRIRLISRQLSKSIRHLSWIQMFWRRCLISRMK